MSYAESSIAEKPRVKMNGENVIVGLVGLTGIAAFHRGFHWPTIIQELLPLRLQVVEALFLLKTRY